LMVQLLPTATDVPQFWVRQRQNATGPRLRVAATFSHRRQAP
jgi:hypothetical protein